MKEKNFNISNQAINHLEEHDALMGHLIEKAGPIKREVISDPFCALVQSIVFQQLAYGATNTIWKRMIKKVGNMIPTIILSIADDELRECGLSFSKIQYIKNIAKAFIDEKISDEKLLNASNEDVIKMLACIKGIGKWTAEMFLIFCFERQDVFSYGDLGLRKGIKWLYGLDTEPNEQFCNQLINTWKPYSTIVSLYLWEITIQNYFMTSPNELFYEYLKDEKPQTNYFESPMGLIKIVTSQKGLLELDFSEDIVSFADNKDSFLVETIKTQLTQYFNGDRKFFDIPLNLNGTVFQKMVWNTLNTIPYGQTKNYGEIANIIGNQKASRAVGGANNKNKIAIIVPCHRVIGANGALIGYAGGLDKKKYLLEHEANNL